MKLTFLGTAAGEGYPGLWCDCKNCRYAREHGGKNVRENSCAALDGDVLLDLNMTAFSQARRFGVDLRRARVLLVTHAHEDHFTPQHLYWRRMPAGADALTWEQQHDVGAPRFTRLPRLHIAGPRYALSALREKELHGGVPTAQGGGGEGVWSDEAGDMDFTVVRAGERLTFPDVADLAVTPVRALHGPEADFTFNYVIERGGKTLLYALDTGGYDDEMRAVLSRFCFDAVVLEGTCGLTRRDPGGHMNAQKDREMVRYLESHGLLRAGARVYLSHLSPHWAPPHDAYAPMMAAEGMTVAYDGLTVSV